MSYEAELAADYAAARSRLYGLPKPKRIRASVAAPAVPATPRARDILDLTPPVELWTPLEELDCAMSPFRVSETVKSIIAFVSRKHDVARAAILSPNKEAAVVRARQEAMYLIRRHTPLSLPQIGQRFDRDHTSVLNGIRRHEARMREAAQ